MADADHFPIPPAFDNTLVCVSPGKGSTPDQIVFWDFTNAEAAQAAAQFITTTLTGWSTSVVAKHRPRST